MANRPGGELAKQPLHFIWLLDCSGRMRGTKIESLNSFIREWIRPMQELADKAPHAQMLVRAITFSDGAQWHISRPTDIHDLTWTEVSAEGAVDMGHALLLAAEALDVKNMPERALPPVLVLISAAPPTDNFEGGLKALMAQPWAMKAVRTGIAIGHDADEDVLRKFIGNAEVRTLRADNAGVLMNRIKWVSPWPAVQGQAGATGDPAGVRDARSGLDDVVRHWLVELVARYGPELGLDSRRSKNLLRDMCPGNERKPAIAALSAAAMESVPAELMRPCVALPIEALLGHLSKRLYDHCGIDAPLARWAVESWALSLGLISAGQLTPLECGLRNHDGDPSRTRYVPLRAGPPRSLGTTDDIF